MRQPSRQRNWWTQVTEEGLPVPKWRPKVHYWLTDRRLGTRQQCPAPEPTLGRGEGRAPRGLIKWVILLESLLSSTLGSSRRLQPFVVYQLRGTAGSRSLAIKKFDEVKLDRQRNHDNDDNPWYWWWWSCWWCSRRKYYTKIIRKIFGLAKHQAWTGFGVWGLGLP